MSEISEIDDHKSVSKTMFLLELSRKDLQKNTIEGKQKTVYNKTCQSLTEFG